MNDKLVILGWLVCTAAAQAQTSLPPLSASGAGPASRSASPSASPSASLSASPSPRSSTSPASAQALPPGARSITVTEAELQREVGQRFPLHRSLQGVLQVELSQPRIRLQPERNRLGTEVALRVSEPFTGRSHDGEVQLSYGLRYEAGDRSLRMTHVEVQRVHFPAVPEPYRSLLADQAPPVIAQAMQGLQVFQAKPEQTAVLEGLGFTIGEFQVTPAGLRVVLLPALAAPPASGQ